jgi:glycosyltransferase involved in cell wall biosynthesis
MRRASLTKWAGENGAFPGERLPSRVQRWVEALPPRRHRVLVYGPARRANQVSFLPALMGSEEIARAQQLSRDRPSPPPFRILSVGRLDAVKGFALALRGLGRLAQRRPDLEWRYTLVGDGPEKEALRELAAREGITERIRFAGAKSFAEVQEEYAGAHLSIMPGVQEGWPKTIAESWAHGVFPLAARAGLVPWILGEPGRGILFDPSAEGLAASLEVGMEMPSRPLPQDLRRLAADLSLESFRDRLEQILAGDYALSRVDGPR